VKQLAAHPFIQPPKDSKKVQSQKQQWLVQHTILMDKKPEEIIEKTPRFYIIPKIHKNPWKGRPIMPENSCLHSLAAKMASMMLKPLIGSQPYIIHGTKHFIQQIEKVRFNLSEKIFIVGGDIEAYYPSVPTPEAVRITKEMMEVEPHSSTPTFTSGFFDECLDTANSTIVMRFQEDWYAQTDGLAMGMAHSPDLANIYGLHFENQIVPNIPGVLYYGCYIDDVIFIIQAASKEDAETKVNALKIGTCRIAWEPASSYGVFLDVRLWIENGVIHHRPH
jgi:hypothetical protein